MTRPVTWSVLRSGDAVGVVVGDAVGGVVGVAVSDAVGYYRSCDAVGDAVRLRGR